MTNFELTLNGHNQKILLALKDDVLVASAYVWFEDGTWHASPKNLYACNPAQEREAKKARDVAINKFFRASEKRIQKMLDDAEINYYHN